MEGFVEFSRYFCVFGLAVGAICLFFTLLLLPTAMAKKKGADKSGCSLVFWLSLCGIIFPPLWLIALLIGLLYPTKG